MINIETYSQLPNMCQSRDIGLDILCCGKWKKISNFKNFKITNVELV